MPFPQLPTMKDIVDSILSALLIIMIAAFCFGMIEVYKCSGDRRPACLAKMREERKQSLKRELLNIEVEEKLLNE